jgi:hypothetical protein
MECLGRFVWKMSGGVPETAEFVVIEFGSLRSGEACPISSLIGLAP